MKYTSLTDLLDLSLDQIAELNANSIIRLQKQLKAKAMLEDVNNIGEITKIIDDLKNDSRRECYIFVEKHAWLKHLISGNFEDIRLKDIYIDESSIQDLETLKYFLNDYFKENLVIYIGDALNKGKYEHIYKTLQHNYLFTEAINQLVINFFKARLNYACAYLQKGKLSEKQYPVAFISNKKFIDSLNTYPDAFNDEILELNSEVIDTYNRLRRNTSRDNFKFCARVMVAFAHLDTSKVFLKETLESNAEIAKEYAFSSTRDKEKSGSGSNSWSIVFIVFIVIRLIIWIAKDVSNDSRPDFNSINFENFDYRSTDTNDNSPNLTRLDSVIKEMQKGNADSEDLKRVLTDGYKSSKNTNSNEGKYKLSNHIRFLYMMRQKVIRKDSTDLNPTELEAFSNPYPKTFNFLPYYSIKNIDNTTFLRNSSNEDLIVFRLKEGIDQSIYIPKNKSTYINLREKDCLVFYTGNDFIQTSLSYFNKNTDFSYLYKVDSLLSKNTEITVLPFEDKTYESRRLQKTEVKVRTRRIDKIEPKNIDLIPINIDALYAKYYQKKYRSY